MYFHEMHSEFYHFSDFLKFRKVLHGRDYFIATLGFTF